MVVVENRGNDLSPSLSHLRRHVARAKLARSWLQWLQRSPGLPVQGRERSAHLEHEGVRAAEKAVKVAGSMHEHARVRAANSKAGAAAFWGMGACVDDARDRRGAYTHAPS